MPEVENDNQDNFNKINVIKAVTDSLKLTAEMMQITKIYRTGSKTNGNWPVVALFSDIAVINIIYFQTECQVPKKQAPYVGKQNNTDVQQPRQIFLE